MMDNNEKTMLALAALTYRGFGKHSERAIHQALVPWLPKLEQENLGKWDLVWGPASFRVPTSLVDDAMVYVVREKDRAAGLPPRYVVAIRGTNPVSAFDWVFGDFWVSLQIDWPHGSPAKLSASTALGLNIVRHLAADDPPSDLTAGLSSVSSTIMEALQDFSSGLPELLPDRVLNSPQEIPDDVLLGRIAALGHRGHETVHARFFDRLLRTFGQSIEQRVFDALQQNIESVRDKGETLEAFLNGTNLDKAVIAVTGHSKGGALAAATALWLDETLPPAKNAQIECYSFAGPTPGNAAFAERFNARLANRTTRVVNRRDVVSQAWVPGSMTAMGEIYPKLKPALNAIVSTVASSGYMHVGGKVVKIDSSPMTGNLVAELAHQHLEAYLKAAGFKNPEWNAPSLFLSN